MAQQPHRDKLLCALFGTYPGGVRNIDTLSRDGHSASHSPLLFLSSAFCLPSQVLKGSVKALWIVSNLIVLILLPVHGRRKSAHRVGFPFVMALSSPPGNTPHSSHNHSLCESGYCGWACYADNPPSSQCNASKYHRSLDLYFCKQGLIMSGVFSAILAALLFWHIPSRLWRTFCAHPRLRYDLRSATSGQITTPTCHTWTPICQI